MLTLDEVKPFLFQKPPCHAQDCFEHPNGQFVIHKLSQIVTNCEGTVRKPVAASMLLFKL